MKPWASAHDERLAIAPAAWFFVACAAGALSMLSAVSAAAMTKEELIRELQPVTDIAANQRLERDFAALVDKNDEAGVKALAARIRAENGNALDGFAEIAQQLNADTTQPVGSAADVALLLGPCHYAGVMLRMIVTQSASGDAKPVFRSNTVMIDDSAIDTLFSQHMDRCESIGDKLSPARLIGNRCLSAGEGCGDDPDFADQNTAR